MGKVRFRISVSLTLIYITFLTGFSGIILILYGRGLTAFGLKFDILTDTFLGVSVEGWKLNHTVYSAIWLISASLHMYYNRRALSSYFGGNIGGRTKKRAVISIILLIATAILGLTGLILFISVPINLGVFYSGEGAVEYAYYLRTIPFLSVYYGRGFGRLLSLPSTLHTLIGILGIFVIGYHIYLNGRPIKAYYGIRSRRENDGDGRKVLKYIPRYAKEHLIALIVTVMTVLLPPLTASIFG